MASRMKQRTKLAIGTGVLVLALIIVMGGSWIFDVFQYSLKGEKNIVVFANDDWTVWAKFWPDWRMRRHCGGPYFNCRLYLMPYHANTRIRIPGFIDYRSLRANHKSGLDWVFPDRTIAYHESGPFNDGAIKLWHIHPDGRTNSWMIAMPEDMRSYPYDRPEIVAASDSGVVLSTDYCNDPSKQANRFLLVIPWDGSGVASNWTTTAVVDGRTNKVIHCSNITERLSIPYVGMSRYPLVYWQGDLITTMWSSNHVFVYNVVTKEQNVIPCPTKLMSSICMLDSKTILVKDSLVMGGGGDCFIINIPENSVRPADMAIDGTNPCIIKKIPSWQEIFVQRGNIANP